MLSEKDLIFLGASMFLSGTIEPTNVDIMHAVEASKELFNEVFNKENEEE